MVFNEHEGGAGRLALGARVTNQKTQMPCFPLYSLLLAMNRTKVDYFSLDVEGVELPILKTIPFDKLDISVLSVEYGHGQIEPLKEYMSQQGYDVYKQIHFVDLQQVLFVEDLIFVKRGLVEIPKEGD